MLTSIALAYALFAADAPAVLPVIILSADALPANMARNNVDAEPATCDGRPCIRVRFHKADWPNVYFTPPDGTWDWSASAGLAIDVYNQEREPVPVCVRVDNAGADGARNCGTACATVEPKQWATLRLWFNSGKPSPFWGMRGTPDRGPAAQSAAIDPSKITAFQVFLPRPGKERTLLVSDIRLFGTSDELQIALPFVDRFGQYKHATWPGKLGSEQELARRWADEQRSIKAAPELPGRDEYGGWANGPKLPATGWFRTQKIDGRWWLVTPKGSLFFSVGVDCLNYWDRTFIEKREPWFEWLPDPEGEFKSAYGFAQNVHSMAETIGGKGRTFNFYMANLMRKYGKDWPEKWRDASYARLKAWGFNTIGNWSAPDVLANSPMPFVTTLGVSGDFRRIEGGGGYWSKMPDVYDPKFAEAAEAGMAGAKQYASNPLCIGYFVDNEIAWDAVERGPLASPPDQPCRIEQVRRLRQKYGSIEGLNKTWGTSAADWDSLRVPDQPNDACREDLNAFVHAFARRYFLIIKNALRKHAPNQLYLGCRFAWSHKEAVRACAEVADVVSFNIYRTQVNRADWTGENDLGKPIIIGEFHFGALDRGMFHQGLVPTRNQNERAAAFRRYVESVADCPAFVGCHWFQYVDEPLTGRIYDGENYNIGLVDVTDTPYPELTLAAKKVNAEVYSRHSRAR